MAIRLAIIAIGITISAMAHGALSPAFGEDSLPLQDRPSQDKAPGLQAGANSFAEPQARALIEARGFSDVSKLVNDSHGIWRGTAIKGSQKVSVSVDFRGNVATHD